MRARRYVFLLIPCLISLHAAAAIAPAATQRFPDSMEKFWVRLRDKGPGTCSCVASACATCPGESAACASACRSDQAIRSYENLPLYGSYLDSLKAVGFRIETSLKWQNLVSGRMEPAMLEKLKALSFVIEIRPFPHKAKTKSLPGPAPLPWWPHPLVPPTPLGPNLRGTPGSGGPRIGSLAKAAVDGFDYGASKGILDTVQVARLHEWMAGVGMRPGLGMKVAVIDADFHMGHAAFDPLFNENRILDQWDFVDDKPQAVFRDFEDSHGADCLSLIGGNLPGTLMGVAPNAQFLLYRSEDDLNERYIEEDFVASAIERAVDSGAQVISISLGYRYEYTDGSPDLPYSAFDGRTRPSSLAALGAARRNVLVSVAVGNLPDSLPALPSLSAPSDADSILAVGILDRFRQKCSYSCTGPSADGRIKPDLASMGTQSGCRVPFANTKTPGNTVDQGAGTSFAAPVVAGIATLLRQIRPQLSAEDIRQALLKSAGQANKPDDLVGFGLVNAWAALLKSYGGTFPAVSDGRTFTLYHSGGQSPLFLPWDPAFGVPNMEVIELNGRHIAVTSSVLGPTLLIQPDHSLRSGVYIVRIHP